MFRKLTRDVVMLGLAILFMVVSVNAGAATLAKAKSGGTLNVAVMNVSWPELIPATDPHATSDIEFMNSIYGQLFTESSKGVIGYDLATGAQFSNHNETLTIELRKGVEFTDGTPFDAQAVATDLDQDFIPANACDCLDDFGIVTNVATSGKYTVKVNTSRPDPLLVEAFIDDSPNWILSPTALAQEGASTFGQKPVGAGPFEVVSDVSSSSLDLVKNPHYWEKGHPYLSALNFTDVTLDQTAFDDLESGGVQMVVGVTTPSVVLQAQGQYQVTKVPGVTATTLEFNTTVPPMNNILAREAVTYATNPLQILQTVSPNYGSVIQDQQGPGGLYFERNVPGYKSYDLSKAEQLVHSLGGLNLTIQGTNSNAALTELEALRTQLDVAGINVTIQPETLTVEEANFANNNWEALTGASGEADPDIGQAGLTRRFESGGSYSCCNDPTLNGLINQSDQLAAPAVRQKLFDKIYSYIAKQDLVDELYVPPVSTLSSKSVGGIVTVPSPSGGVYIPWGDIYLK